MRWPAVLEPTPGPWAVDRAVWALVAALAVAGVGLASGHPEVGALAYFGVTCASIFITSGAYRTRLIMGVGPGAGAAIGIVLGVAVSDSVPAKIVTSAAVALVSGAIGAIGPMTTAFALMAEIGLAFGQFARVDLSQWQQSLWYLIGSAVVIVLAVGAWPVRRDRPEWTAVSAVFEQSARLLTAVATARAPSERAELAATSATCRSEVFDYQLGRRPSRRRSRLLIATSRAEQVALVAADSHARAEPVDATTVQSLHLAAHECRAERVPALPDGFLPREPLVRAVPPWPERLAGAVAVVTSGSAIASGLRLSLCMTLATALTCALHDESHSFWLPLTVAVAVRPEYASVYVRTLNRVAGTLAGGIVAAAVVFAFGSGWPVAITAALALGFAVLAAPKLYALSVVGVTCSALLAASIAHPDPVNPALRVLDTVLGAAIALIFGYLLWPGRRTLPASVAGSDATDAARQYLAEAVRPPAERVAFVPTLDRAYRLAHQRRQTLHAALREPPPVRDDAAALLPNALALEDIVDEITAIADAVDAGRPIPVDVADLSDRLSRA